MLEEEKNIWCVREWDSSRWFDSLDLFTGEENEQVSEILCAFHCLFKRNMKLYRFYHSTVLSLYFSHVLFLSNYLSLNVCRVAVLRVLMDLLVCVCVCLLPLTTWIILQFYTWQCFIKLGYRVGCMRKWIHSVRKIRKNVSWICKFIQISLSLRVYCICVYIYL